ncbi:MAG: sigma 54-interacting transcriptional regulator [Veillonellaceae bacterium]|nr:sigma 54-interacting transcriptional regulator [Veillonellaceae bacterium]
MKKTVCVVGHTESTCNYITHQLLKFLGQHINLTSWSIAQSSIPPPFLGMADIFVVSNRNVWRSVESQFPAEKPVLIANRVLGPECLDKLFSLEPGSKVNVVGTTEETVSNTISILQSFGFRDFQFVPYYPGILGKIDEEISVAITTGLSHLVPKHIKTIIDLGGKGLNLSTFAELLQYLGVPMTILNDISHFYLETILYNTQKIRTMGQQSERLKNNMEVILDTVDEAILAVDEKTDVILWNQAAESILKINHQQVLGRKLNSIFPEIDLSGYLEQRIGVNHEIRSIADKHYFLNANVIINNGRSVDGMVATLRPIQEIQELDVQIRQELKNNGKTAKYKFENIVGNSPALNKSILLSKRFAQTELTILLEAETGAGKELFAHSIHNVSPRRNGPFIAVNFAAIPESLVESELFGYESGAFTGARKGGKPGLFEEAHMGTIFLDEIGSASSEVQNRLLRVLEEHEVRRIGSGKITPIDVRVIAASNVNLETLVAKGKFREDLFYRLCSLPITIPPLRNRREDILTLVRHFAGKHSRPKLTLTPELTDFLTHYDWPGNVRELQNIVQFLCSVVEKGRQADLQDIPPYLQRKANITDDSISSMEAAPALADLLVDPRTAELIAGILTEIKNKSLLLSGVGWQTLIKQMDNRLKISEHQMKKWLKLLKQSGYVETGKTRQGTRITPKGEELLARLAAKKETEPRV